MRDLFMQFILKTAEYFSKVQWPLEPAGGSKELWAMTRQGISSSAPNCDYKPQLENVCPWK